MVIPWYFDIYMIVYIYFDIPYIHGFYMAIQSTSNNITMWYFLLSAYKCVNVHITVNLHMYVRSKSTVDVLQKYS